MRVSPRVLSTRAHKPLISFIGKRSWPSTPEAQHAHPAAPTELKQSFDQFLKKFQNPPQQAQSATSQLSSTPGAYEEFWEAPSRYWNPRVRQLSEEEIDAVLSGGATL